MLRCVCVLVFLASLLQFLKQVFLAKHVRPDLRSYF